VHLIHNILSGKYVYFLVGLLFSCQVLATEELLRPADILYILSKNSALYQEFTDNVQKHTNTSGNSSQHRRSLRLFSSNPKVLPEINAGYKLVVSVGSEALKVVSESGYQGPVFSVLTPATSFKQYKRSEKYSALYADHPVSLYLKLISLAMPESNRIGVLLGPSSSLYEDELKDTAEALGLRLHIMKTAHSRHVSRQIGQLAADVDVILAIPDPIVHNPRTAQSILLAGYRNNIPVVAYSSSYIKAGALIGLYSTPEQLAEDAASHILEQLENDSLQKAPPSYPSTFSIGINRNVARSLGREELDEVTLKNLLITNRPAKQ
jgi:ABC-type uncharacterized transport system substrate-binding protein